MIRRLFYRLVDAWAAHHARRLDRCLIPGYRVKLTAPHDGVDCIDALQTYCGWRWSTALSALAPDGRRATIARSAEGWGIEVTEEA